MPRTVSRCLISSFSLTDLNIAVSTVRSHLHKTYKKIGAADRAQAVLMATERGWL